mmetsp:Transcript_34782/g.61129  ORF Transcript_34782/g.61129 Transcript_34782/m.61129 type:complete len:425 (+) Transcript_34782:71-1345(+)
MIKIVKTSKIETNGKSFRLQRHSSLGKLMGVRENGSDHCVASSLLQKFIINVGVKTYSLALNLRRLRFRIENVEEFIIGAFSLVILVTFLRSFGIGLWNLKSLRWRWPACSLHVGGNDLLAILATEKTSMSLDANQKGEETRCNNGTSHDVKGWNGIQLAETKTKAHSSKVTTSTDNPGNASCNRRIDIRHNSVGGSLSGLNYGGEKYHDDNGSRKRVGVGKDEHQYTLDDEKTTLPHETALHTHLGVELIRRISTNTTGKEIHPAKDGGDGGRTLGGEFKLLPKVRRGGIVHCELDSEAAGVLKEENPGVEVHGATAEGGTCRDLGHGSVLFHISIVSLGSIIRNPHNEKSKAKSNNSGDDAHSPPSHLGRHAKLEEGEENSSHDELGNTSSKVTPAAHDCIGGTGDFLREHAGRPELAADEG